MAVHGVALSLSLSRYRRVVMSVPLWMMVPSGNVRLLLDDRNWMLIFRLFLFFFSAV